jgi:hypothetical protein
MMKGYRTVLHEKNLADYVLCYCLAVREGIVVGDKLEKRAVARYQECPNDYDRALGSLIPAQLRRLDEHYRYTGNTNATAADDWATFLRVLENHRQQGPGGLLTGIRVLDEAIGGLRDVTLLAGQTGAGKTTLALNLALGVLRHQKDAGVVVFHFESEKHKYYAKLLSRESGIDYRTVSNGEWSGAAKEAITQAQERLKAEILPRLRLVSRLEVPTGGQLTKQALTQKIQGFLEATGVKTALVIVDRVQQLEPPRKVEHRPDGGASQFEDLDDLEASSGRMEILLGIQAWSRSIVPGGFAVVGLSRVNKTEQGRPLVIGDVPGKAEVVFQADSVLLLEPALGSVGAGDITRTLLNVAKVRDGGRKGDVYLDFHHTVSLFRECTQPGPGAPRATQGAAAKGAAAGKRFRGRSY